MAFPPPPFTRGSTMKLIDLLLGGPAPEKIWKPVGQFTFAYQHTYNAKKEDRAAVVMFYMTEQDDRRIEIVGCDNADRDWINNRIPMAHAWTKGGKFPGDFVPCDDTLGEMLTRMIDAKLTGKDK